MGKSRQDASIECPYYTESKGKYITCEGGLHPLCTTATKFKTEARRKEFMGHFCKRYYSLCPLLQTNDRNLGFKRPDPRERAEENE